MTDPVLRRIERTAVVACVVMAVIAFALARGRPGAPLAVLAGGLLMAVSYMSMKSSVGAGVLLLAPRTEPEGTPRRPGIAWIALKMAGRYALLGLLAYVMIARLRLHPLGLLAGVSSVVAAASIEAIRLQLQKKP